jgi:hypothetical protein
MRVIIAIKYCTPAIKTVSAMAGLALIMLLQSGCARSVYGFRTIEIHIPGEINLNEGEIRSRLKPFAAAGDNGFTLRITVYGFSQGAEIINFSDSNQLSTKRGKAWIKALVLVKKDERIVQADFIEITGKNREEILDRLGAAVIKITGR